MVDGSVCLAQTDEEKSNLFCNYFSSVFNVESDSSFDSLPIVENLPCMSSIIFYYDDIVTRLKKLNINKSEGPDGIHPRVLLENAEILAYPLTLIFGSSFKFGSLPLDWRSANITAIF